MLNTGAVTEEERKDYLSRMEVESERLSSIISDLLDYAQPSSLEIQNINLNDIIRNTYSFVSCQKEFKSIAPVFHLEDSLPLLYASEKHIRQLMLNLILNARDAMSEGGNLTFTTRFDRTKKDDKILLTVADTGEGISEEISEKIFDPFFTTKQQGKGTGLGLSNVHRIVELTGGKISFSSTPGAGTSFIIEFPATGRQVGN